MLFFSCYHRPLRLKLNPLTKAPLQKISMSKIQAHVQIMKAMMMMRLMNLAIMLLAALKLSRTWASLRIASKTLMQAHLGILLKMLILFKPSSLEHLRRLQSLRIRFLPLSLRIRRLKLLQARIDQQQRLHSLALRINPQSPPPQTPPPPPPPLPPTRRACRRGSSRRSTRCTTAAC